MNEITQTQDLGFVPPPPKIDDTSLMQVESNRAVAEVQAAYVIAKKFPRNQSECYANIIDACKRPFLAEQAMYAYPRGGTLVQGPSIRLAEVIAQCWGNIDFGIRELSQSNGFSVAEAYAIDLQTNSRATKIFHVPHIRDSRKGKTKLTDARDIYEIVANHGARRLRACILAILPGDVLEAAVDRCKKTLESSDVPIKDQIRRMILAFDEFGVKVEHLEKRLGHKMESTIPAEIVTLKSIYKSIKDGMSKREDFFDLGFNKGAEESIEDIIHQKKKGSGYQKESKTMDNMESNTQDMLKETNDKK